MESVKYQIQGFKADGTKIETVNFESGYGPVSENMACNMALLYSGHWDAANVEVYRLEHVVTVPGPNFVPPEPEVLTAEDDMPF